MFFEPKYCLFVGMPQDASIQEEQRALHRGDCISCKDKLRGTHI